MSYKCEVQTGGSDAWTSNALRFKTQKEAQEYGIDLAMRWTAVSGIRAKRSKNSITHTWDARGLRSVDEVGHAE